MPAKGQSKTVVTCPHCGHRQQEAPTAYSTICKGCKQHFRVQESLRPNHEAKETPRDLRQVSCFQCQTVLDVPVTAQSTMCKRCSTHLDLRDYNITSTVSKNFRTKGRFVIESNGYLLNSDTTATEVVLKGKIIGNLVAEKLLEIHTGAEIKGKFSAGHLLIPAGHKFRWTDVITAGVTEVGGELVANVRAAKMLIVRSTARFFGNVEAANLVVESGAVFVGSVKIMAPAPQPAPGSAPIAKTLAAL